MLKIHRKNYIFPKFIFYGQIVLPDDILKIHIFGAKIQMLQFFILKHNEISLWCNQKVVKKSVARSLQKCEMYHQNRRENNLLFTKKITNHFQRGMQRSKIQSVKSGASLANRITITVAQKNAWIFHMYRGPLEITRAQPTKLSLAYWHISTQWKDFLAGFSVTCSKIKRIQFVAQSECLFW